MSNCSAADLLLCAVTLDSPLVLCDSQFYTPPFSIPVETGKHVRQPWSMGPLLSFCSSSQLMCFHHLLLEPLFSFSLIYEVFKQVLIRHEPLVQVLPPGEIEFFEIGHVNTLLVRRESVLAC